ncbi:MAG: hypothetical protein OEM91_14280 [Hyphomicrobiales bacterium]|nr:hypothetical protein [Hyphomicrobiales bacterium]
MGRAIFAMILIAAAAFLGWQWIDGNAKRATADQEWRKEESATRARVAALVDRTNAVTDWEAQLAQGDTKRLTPVMTLELEKLWLGTRPILFLGRIKDVASLDTSHYMISIHRSGLSSLQLYLATELELALVADKAQFDELLARIPAMLNSSSILESIAFVGRIRSIESRTVTDNFGDANEVRIGRGEFLGLEYVGEFDVNL